MEIKWLARRQHKASNALYIVKKPASLTHFNDRNPKYGNYNEYNNEYSADNHELNVLSVLSYAFPYVDCKYDAARVKNRS